MLIICQLMPCEQEVLKTASELMLRAKQATASSTENGDGASMQTPSVSDMLSCNSFFYSAAEIS